jgi:type II restriction/modification system DNA methylase subunit YeeA
LSKSLNDHCDQGLVKNFFRVKAEDFQSIPGFPIAYWASTALINSFKSKVRLGERLDTAQGMKTLDNERFIREWSEVSFFTITNSENFQKKWVPINHGGGYRKWYGLNSSVLNWTNDGSAIKALAKEKYNSITRTVTGMGHYFENGITWSAISTDFISVRKFPDGFIFTNAGMCAFGPLKNQLAVAALLNSKVGVEVLKILAPSVNFGPNQISEIPVAELDNIGSKLIGPVNTLIEIARFDWDLYESSSNFTNFPLLNTGSYHVLLADSYKAIRAQWCDFAKRMQRLENEVNENLVHAYGLQDELSPEVPLNEITLTCNPHYRYGGDKTEEELEALLLADTMREFISYAVGCMFGRYALDKPGLVLANQGETIEDYRRQVPNSRFEADADNVIPMLDGEWFADDVTERFRQFLRVTFGDDHYDVNLVFIEQALNPKGKRNFTLRDYMLGEFYTDHVKRYKKRPIYWLFSSPKGTFNALIYLHRYRPDTASVVLRYLREFRAKLAARQSTLEQVLINPATSQGEKTKAVKEIDSLKKQIIELQDYENDTLYPLATANVALDLDDGVKLNYLKLGAALKKITGLDAKEED